jgi:uncharacterized protein (TIGR02301 family)
MPRGFYLCRLIFMINISLLTFGPAVLAQSSPVLRSVPKPVVSSSSKPQAPPVLPQEPAIAPYERDMQRLSEVMGSLAFLRNLCGAKDAADWIVQMRALLESEGASSIRRERLIAAYNQGFQSFALTYRRCTAAAELASSLYLQEGETLTRALTGRFGG